MYLCMFTSVTKNVLNDFIDYYTSSELYVKVLELDSGSYIPILEPDHGYP